MNLGSSGLRGLDHNGIRRTDDEVRALIGLPPLTPEQRERLDCQRKEAKVAAYTKSDAAKYQKIIEAEKEEDRKYAHKRTYRDATIENIPLRGDIAFACGGVANYTSDNVYVGYTSVLSRRQECKIMVTYFIRCGETDFVKIGKSNRVESRLENLQSANPHSLDLLLCLPHLMGFREEDMHYLFEGHRQRGEWFSYTTDLKAFVEDKRKLRISPADLSLKPTAEDFKLAGCGDPILVESHG